MYSRFVALLAVLSLGVCLIVPVGAWNAESFLEGDSSEYEPVASAEASSNASLYSSAAAQASEESMISISGSDFASCLSTTITLANLVEVYHPAETVVGVKVPEYTAYCPYPEDGYAMSLSMDGSGCLYGTFSGTVPNELKDYDTVASRGVVFSPLQSLYIDLISTDSNVVLPFDISSFGEFSVFELSGTISSSLAYGSSVSVYASSVDLFVNDALVETFYSGDSSFIDFANFIYEGSVPVTSLAFRFTYPFWKSSFGSRDFSIRFSLYGDGAYAPVASVFSVLADDPVVSGYIDDAQNSIDDYNAMESEWTGSMTENFNSIDFDGFAFDPSLISAFALYTGIFNDIWNAFGLYNVMWVIPLMLGIVLLVVGRISRKGGSS